jgi:hypothetical protein
VPEVLEVLEVPEVPEEVLPLLVALVLGPGQPWPGYLFGSLSSQSPEQVSYPSWSLSTQFVTPVVPPVPAGLLLPQPVARAKAKQAIHISVRFIPASLTEL